MVRSASAFEAYIVACFCHREILQCQSAREVADTRLNHKLSLPNDTPRPCASRETDLSPPLASLTASSLNSAGYGRFVLPIVNSFPRYYVPGLRASTKPGPAQCANEYGRLTCGPFRYMIPARAKWNSIPLPVRGRSALWGLSSALNQSIWPALSGPVSFAQRRGLPLDWCR